MLKMEIIRREDNSLIEDLKKRGKKTGKVKKEVHQEIVASTTGKAFSTPKKTSLFSLSGKTREYIQIFEMSKFLPFHLPSSLNSRMVFKCGDLELVAQQGSSPVEAVASLRGQLRETRNLHLKCGEFCLGRADLTLSPPESCQNPERKWRLPVYRS